MQGIPLNQEEIEEYRAAMAAFNWREESEHKVEKKKRAASKEKQARSLDGNRIVKALGKAESSNQ